MCPACLVTAVLIASGASTGGGATALVLSRLVRRCRRLPGEAAEQAPTNGNPTEGWSQTRAALQMQAVVAHGAEDVRGRNGLGEFAAARCEAINYRRQS